MQALEDLGELAEPALRQALAQRPHLEVRRRLEQLLAKLAPDLPPAQLQVLRALAVLEWIGTPEARRLLEALAGGGEGARLTREARQAAQRLARRAALPFAPARGAGIP